MSNWLKKVRVLELKRMKITRERQFICLEWHALHVRVSSISFFIYDLHMYCKFKGIVSLFKTHGDPIYPKFKSAMICSPMRPVSPLTSISATNIPYFPSFISINFLYKKIQSFGGFTSSSPIQSTNKYRCYNRAKGPHSFV